MGKRGNLTFGCDFTLYEEIVKEVNNLKIRKASQETDIPVNIVKENIDIVSIFCIITRCHVLLLPLV